MSDHGDNGFGPVDAGGRSGRGRRDQDRDAVRQRAQRRMLGRQGDPDNAFAGPERGEPPASPYPDLPPTPPGLPPRRPSRETSLPGLPRRQDTGSFPALPAPAPPPPPAYPPAPLPPPRAPEEPSPEWLLPGVAIVAVVAVILAVVAVAWMFGVRP
jgi:hypothetical protein